MTTPLCTQSESARTNAVDLARESISNGERVDFFCDHCDVEHHANLDLCTEVDGRLFSIQAGEGVDRIVRLTCETTKKYFHEDCYHALHPTPDITHQSPPQAIEIDVTVFNSTQQLIDIFVRFQGEKTLPEDAWEPVFALLDAGASPRISNGKGQTLLYYAIASGDQERVGRLFDTCPIETFLHADRSGRNALHYAAQLEDPGILTYLLSLEKLNSNLKDQEGKTPLHLAVHARNLEMVAAMTPNPRVNLELTDNDGKPPIQYAREEGSEEIRSLLEAASEYRRPRIARDHRRFDPTVKEVIIMVLATPVLVLLCILVALSMAGSALVEFVTNTVSQRLIHPIKNLFSRLISPPPTSE